MENLKEGESGRTECISAPPAEMRDERRSALEDTYTFPSEGSTKNIKMQKRRKQESKTYLDTDRSNFLTNSAHQRYGTSDKFFLFKKCMLEICTSKFILDRTRCHFLDIF